MANAPTTSVQQDENNLTSNSVIAGENQAAASSNTTKDTVSVLEFLTGGTCQRKVLTRNELLVKAQEKCKQIYNSTLGAFRQTDLRLLSAYDWVSPPESLVVVRRFAVLISINGLQALVLWDRMFLFVPAEATDVIDLIQSKFIELSSGLLDSNLTFGRPPTLSSLGDLTAMDVQAESSISKSDNQFHKRSNVAFEICAYEAVLWTAMKLFQRNHSRLKPEITRITGMLLSDQAFATLDALWRVREQTAELQSRVENDVAVLCDLTLDDREMALMSFSNMLRDPARYQLELPAWSDDHKDVEILIEAYIQRFGSLVQDVRFSLDKMTLTESSVSVVLDINRNKVIKLNIVVNSVTSFSAIGAFISGMFSVNINSYMETIMDPPVFVIEATLLFGLFLVCVVGLIWFSYRQL